MGCCRLCAPPVVLDNASQNIAVDLTVDVGACEKGGRAEMRLFFLSTFRNKNGDKGVV